MALLALLMMILQAFFFFKRPQFTWYAWGAAMSFSALIYAVGIFLEYNTPQGHLNRFSGLLEFAAVICVVHSLYGFTFAYLHIRSRRYHSIAGVFHGLILILLWTTNYIVADTFAIQNFMGLSAPYTEPALGPLGPLFMFYGVGASVNAMIIWIRHQSPKPAHWMAFPIGTTIWIVLGLHDALASMGVPAFQYFMEYGFLGFAVAVLWVTFNSYLEISAQEKYRVITQFANDCILVIQDQKVVYGNPACSDLTGRPVTDSGFIGLLDIIGMENREAVLRYYKAFLEGRPAGKTLAVDIRRADGEERSAELVSAPIQYMQRPAVLSVIRDMTERNRAEEKLRESEEKYRSMMEAMRDGVYISSPDFRITYMNPSMIKMIGRDATGEICHKALVHTNSPCSWCLHPKVHQGDMAETEFVNPKDKRAYHLTHSPIFHEDGSISTMIILRDITKTKQMQQQVLHAERLSTTGQLAATFAHEINSPLQAIISLVNSIKRTHDQDKTLLQKLKLIKNGIFNIRDTVRKLLDLTRPVKEKMELINVNRVIEDTAGLLRIHLKKNQVSLLLNLSPALPRINASPQQLGHVFMNLISNAVEAMAQPATSKENLQDGTKDQKSITVESQLRNGTVAISVKDTGPGISETDMAHIFEPFYTRKKQMGMGIGLSLCQNIIHDHKGTITAENASEGGAVFTVILPIE